MSLKDSIETGMQDLKEKLSQAVQDSPIFQQIKAKYDELDANQKLAVTGGSASIVALVILFSVYQLGSSVRATKQDLADKNDLIRNLGSLKLAAKHLLVEYKPCRERVGLVKLFWRHA
jgi:hypothetical protein